jgi:acyl-coenzyme A synthetase/AMP-(fatty) acid ligase
LVTFLNDRLADCKVPRRIIFASDFPRSGTDKVQENELKELFSPSRLPEPLSAAGRKQSDSTFGD